MIDKFTFWLESIVEDTPIPYEVKHISFVYTKRNGCFVLMLGGTETAPNLNNMFDFFPLEAQYHFDNELYNITDESYFVKLMQTVIDESFSSDYIKHQYKGKKIYFGKYKEKLKFLFQI